MGIFDKIFRRLPQRWQYALTLNGYSPTYPQFGTNIYMSDAVQQALKCIVDEVKKLIPTHIRMIDSEPVPVPESSISAVLADPNPLMTTSEFLEQVTWLLLLNYNAFIVPTYYTWTDQNTGQERRYYEALYPIKPTQVNFIEDASGRLYVQFFFANGEQTTLAYDDVIHIKYNYSVNQYMGGNEVGQPDNAALLKTLQLNESLLQGVARAMNASYAVNGIVKYNTLMDDGKTEKALKAMEQKLQNSESGFLPLDLKAEFTPLEHRAELVDAETLKFIDEKILRHFGVPLCILTGDYTKAQYEAFYQKTVEPIIIQLSQEFTRVLCHEADGRGHKIQFFAKELIFMSTDQKINMINLLAPTGAMFENEKRAAFGLHPLPELAGKRYQSLNWVEADKANEYQLGQNNEQHDGGAKNEE